MRAAAILILLGVAQTVSVQAKPSPPPIVRAPVTEERVVAEYADWSVGVRSDFIAAYTVNQSDNNFGVLCGKACGAYITTDLACEGGAKYHSLVNSRAGAHAITFQCAKIEGVSVLTTPITDNLVDAVETGGEIGFAIPLASGLFSVSRFSLTGGAKATAHAIRLNQARGNSEGKTGLRDFTI